MSNKVVIVETANRAELKAYTQAIHSFIKLQKRIVYTRKGDHSTAISHELSSDITACGLGNHNPSIIPLTKKSLMSELSTRGLSLEIYLGKSPEAVGKGSSPSKSKTESKVASPSLKTPTQTPSPKEEAPKYTVRMASVCGKCESINRETIQNPTDQASFDRLVSEWKKQAMTEDFEVEVNGNYLNIIDTWACSRC